jgi:hypothetical protein
LKTMNVTEPYFQTLGSAYSRLFKKESTISRQLPPDAWLKPLAAVVTASSLGLSRVEGPG